MGEGRGQDIKKDGRGRKVGDKERGEGRRRIQ